MNDNRRILFVDDDDLVLSCLERILGRRFSLDVAQGAAQALSTIEAGGPYAVVISDMRMPGMSGLELLARMKRDFPETIGVLMSGNAGSDEMDVAIRDGVVFKVLQKPCRSEELIAILEDALEHHARAQGSSRA